MTTRYSLQRLLLILAWISLGTILLFFIAQQFPIYNSDFLLIFISLLCFINAAVPLTKLLGINKKVSDHETILFRKYGLETQQEKLEELQKQIKPFQTLELKKCQLNFG